MKKNFPQRKGAGRIVRTLLAGLILLLLLFTAGVREGVRAQTRDIMAPFFSFSQSVKNFSSRRLARKIEQLENEKKELEVRSSILESRMRELEVMFNTSEERKPEGFSALVVSQAPTIPYDTLLVSFNAGSVISRGMKVLAHRGIYLGQVTEAGDRAAIVRLISYPKLETEAWLERLRVNVTLEGEGGYNLKFSLPKNVRVEVGDRILSNTSPQFLVGQVEVVREKPSEPLQEIRLRLPLNFKNLRYVELVF